nr:hypothetical protein [Streptomyces sp. YSPA8]
MVTATLAALALTAVAPGWAQAAPGAPPSAADRMSGTLPGGIADAPPVDPGGALPQGWRTAGSGTDRELVWVAPRPVPVGGARVEFHSGDRLIGRPLADDDQRTFRLRLDGARIGDGSDLRAVAAGRRLDAAGERGPAGRRSPAPLPPAASLAAADPVNGVDPGKPGPYRTVTGEYRLPPVKLPGFPEPVEMLGTVVGPRNATGTRPLVLFLHGRHYTCYSDQGGEDLAWPCPAGTKPVPSHQGYRHDQRLLASQGYVTVSVAANGINAQDDAAEDGGAQARSSLVRQHLARWAAWAADRKKAPPAVRAVSPADPGRTLLVGHSRGGEGVNRAALDSLTRPPADQDGHRGPVRWNIRGTVLIGPTLFGRNPVPDVPSMTVLPGCDGDVQDLQGQFFADDTRGVGRGAALHSTVYMVGANHNFFNTEWTPGQAQAPAQDDFYAGDPRDRVCAPGTRTRLTAKQQQTAGSTYIAAATRLFVAGDDRVRPLLDGTGRRAPSAGPARVLSHAVGGHRTPFVLPDAAPKVTGGRLCAQVSADRAAACLPQGTVGASPHFTPWVGPNEPGRHAVALRWRKPGAATRMTPARPVSVAGAKALALRVIVPPNTTGTLLDVAVADSSGRRAVLGRVRVDGLPGTDRTTAHWAREVRVPLSAAVRAGVDPKKLTSLELVPRTASGSAWLMDAWGWRPGTPAARPAALPRVDLGRITVKEGDFGSRTYRLPARVLGQGSGQVRVFVTDPVTERVTSKVVTVRAGRAPEVSITVKGDTRYGYDQGHHVFVKGVRGAVTGAYSGGVTVENDDPLPTFTVTPVADRVTEGGELVWKVSMSAPADAHLSADLAVEPPGGAPELSTLDVSPGWLDLYFGVSPAPERPFSSVHDGPRLWADFPVGAREALVSVPTVTDAVAEPEESLRLRLLTYDENGEPVGGPEFTGTVRDGS